MAWRPFVVRTAFLLVATSCVLACQSGDPSVEANGGGGGTSEGEGGAGGTDSLKAGTNGNTMQPSDTGGTMGSVAGNTVDSAVAGKGGGSSVAGQAGTTGVGGAGGAAVSTGGTSGMPADPGACKIAAICDDFEGQTVGKPPAAPWSRAGDSKLQVSEDKAFSGKRSVKIEIAAGEGGTAQISRRDTSLFPVKDQLYMRMMVYLDRTPSGNSLHWAFMQAIGTVADANGKNIGPGSYGVGGHPSQFQSIFVLPTLKNGLGDCWSHSNRTIPTQKWVCVEWHLDVPKDAQEVWSDGQIVPELSFTSVPSGSSGCLNSQTGGKWVVPDLAFAKVGWTHFHVSDGMTLWLDDVVMDKKRIGCPTMKP
jgi:hypothetical protein